LVINLNNIFKKNGQQNPLLPRFISASSLGKKAKAVINIRPR